MTDRTIPAPRPHVARDAAFVGYCLTFYGAGGIYPMRVSRSDIRAALKIHRDNPETDFQGDSFDREAVRDILIEQFGYTWPAR